MREARDEAGEYGPSHGEGKHGVDNKNNKQEEGHLETGISQSGTDIKLLILMAVWF